MARISGRLAFDRTRSAAMSNALTGISGVSIVLQDTDNNLTASVLTASDGTYSFINVPEGNYQVVEKYGFPATAIGTGDFSTATVSAIINGGTVPPIGFVVNPPYGATDLDNTIPNTWKLSVNGANLIGIDFLNAPVAYMPIQEITDANVVIDDVNLITDFDNGTFGTLPAGTDANTGAYPSPYSNVGSDFMLVTPSINLSYTSPDDGQYTIQNILNYGRENSLGNWWNVADHTTGNEMGRMLVVNGYNPGAIILSTTVTVRPETYYLFSAWILNLCTTNLNFANVAFAVNILGSGGNMLYNATLGNIIPNKSDFPEWHEIGTVFNSGNNTAVTVQFISMGPAAIGNDYLIDDIALYAVQVPVFPAIKTATPNSARVNDLITFRVTLENTGESQMENVFFIDPIPDGLEFVPNSVRVNGNQMLGANPNVGFTVPNVQSGESLFVEFLARAIFVPTPNPTINIARINYMYTPVQGGIPSRYETTTNETPVTIIAIPPPTPQEPDPIEPDPLTPDPIEPEPPTPPTPEPFIPQEPEPIEPEPEIPEPEECCCYDDCHDDCCCECPNIFERLSNAICQLFSL